MEVERPVGLDGAGAEPPIPPAIEAIAEMLGAARRRPHVAQRRPERDPPLYLQRKPGIEARLDIPRLERPDGRGDPPPQ